MTGQDEWPDPDAPWIWDRITTQAGLPTGDGRPGEQWHTDESPQPRRLGEGLRARIRAAMEDAGEEAVFVTTPGPRFSLAEWRERMASPTAGAAVPRPERYEYRTIALIGVPTEDGRTIADIRIGPEPGVVTFPYPVFAEGHPAHGQPVWLRLTGNRVEALVNPEWPPLTLAVAYETLAQDAPDRVSLHQCRPTNLGPGVNPWAELR